jgi:hypothetical protein
VRGIKRNGCGVGIQFLFSLTRRFSGISLGKVQPRFCHHTFLSTSESGHMGVRDYVVLTCFHRPTEVNILAQTMHKVKDGC